MTKERYAKILGKTTGIAFLFAGFLALFSILPFILMILFGALGHAFHEPHLYVDYGQSVLLIFLLIFLGLFFGGIRK